MIEKTCCELVWTVRRLRQYILYYTTWLISRMDPIKYIFESPHVARRVSKWQMVLSEYDVKYMTRKSVKRSIIADRLAGHLVVITRCLRFELNSNSRWNCVYKSPIRISD